MLKHVSATATSAISNKAMVIEGIGEYEQFSGKLAINEPIEAKQLAELLRVEQVLADNMLIVRDGRILSDNVLLNNSDVIRLYLAVSGG